MSLKAVFFGLMCLTACGRDGRDGVNGQSITGPKGDPGENSAYFTPIQLCLSCVNHYPDTFAEVAFCYNGSLYATYSTNGGFSAQLVPGRYYSNGINCSCQFTVSNGCIVSN